MNTKYDDNNVYALNVKGAEIHISEAESGKRGYYCLGCDGVMEAMIARIQGRISYFRHSPTDVNYTGKCTYSDETYRHKLAKEFLQLLKYIKVPPVHKYPPYRQQGVANLIKEAEIIHAHSVEMERTFYEDDEGNIKWGSGSGVDEKNLLVKPDVIFFNAEGQPILFIELVATHKVSEEKKVKLKRLGINTVQVRIPKDSPESIENSFKTTLNTKWIYNYDEERTEYVPVSAGNSEELSPLDEQQRKLFEESFKCRQSQVSNLIRSITKVLESKPYRTVEELLREEISRAERNTEGNRTRLDELRERIRSRIQQEFDGRFQELRSAEEEFGAEEASIHANHNRLEERYFRKRKELDEKGRGFEREERLIVGELEGKNEEVGREEADFEARREANRRALAEVQSSIRGSDNKIREFEQEEITLSDGYRSLEQYTVERIEQLTEAEAGEIEQLSHEEEQLPEGFRIDKEGIARLFDQDAKSINDEFENLREQSAKAVEQRNDAGNSELSRGIRDILQTKQLLKDIGEVTANSRRNRKALEAFREGTYRNWDWGGKILPGNG